MNLFLPLAALAGALSPSPSFAMPQAVHASAPQAPPAASSSASPANPQPAAGVPVFTAEIVARFPHDPSAFTEGLVWHDGALFESVGREGVSEVRRVRLSDGRVVRRAAIPASQFGEGLALHGDTLVSLTWKHGIAHRWNAATLKRAGTSRYMGEGWGLADAPAGMILSDGSATLKVLDPATFAERRRVTVTLGGRPMRELNELEMVDGELFANVWHAPYIVAIDPATGQVTRVIDAGALVREVAARDPEAVLNGIAWDSASGRLFLTGKLWPTLYEVRLVATGAYAAVH